MEEKVKSTAEETAAQEAQKEKKLRAVRLLKDNNSVLILVVLLFIGLVLVDGFTTSFYNVFLYSSVYGIVCLGLALVMITGNIDLSLGYMATFCGCSCVLTFNAVYAAMGSELAGVILGLIVALLVGALLGCFNGFIITKCGVSPLIATIATNYIYEGLVLKFASSSFSPTEKSMIQVVAKTKIFGLKWLTPMVIIFVLFIIGIFIWMRKTKFGNRLQVVGDNPEAAEFAGINVKKTVWITYVIAGVCAAVCGFMMVSYSGFAIYTQGVTLGTFPISCCVIGGIKMSGGKGTAVHVLLGVLIMRIISNIMSAMYWNTAWVNLATGIVLIVVLIVDRFTSAKSAD